ncbi:H-NS histone family protein [Aquabacterium humicola]|uniref:H-NS histone family protein n=1 Tax=Aquabacterium humicola TaxID=3237377 RepID=UPI0025430914|nr:H-NS histone family protein [Rubrivivax pictus]
MPKHQTLPVVQQQIEELQRRASALRESEKAGVIDRIKHAIAVYGITAPDLGFTVATRGAARGRRGKAKSAVGVAKYSDGNGNAWSGRGTRPRWLREALLAGKSLQDFEVSRSANEA